MKSYTKMKTLVVFLLISAFPVLAFTDAPLHTTLVPASASAAMLKASTLKAPACKAPVRQANPLAPLNPVKAEPVLTSAIVCQAECHYELSPGGAPGGYMIEVCQIVCHYEAPDLPGCYPNCAD